MTKLAAIMKSVWPSAGLPSSACAPITVLPPGRFSTTTATPASLPTACASDLARASDEPPAAYGTISVSGCEVNFCAAAAADTRHKPKPSMNFFMGTP